MAILQVIWYNKWQQISLKILAYSFISKEDWAVTKSILTGGYEYGFKGYEFDQQMYESTVKICFDAKYGAPVSVEEKELYKIFSDKFYDGYCEGKKVR